MSEKSNESPPPHDEQDDDDFSDLPDSEYPARLGTKWTPAMNKVMEEAIKRLEERERDEGEASSDGE